jgi:pimeloyl-ACP methyl ester carboxylesterase
MSMSTLPSAFRSPKGEAEYMAAYEASMKLWPVTYEPIDITGRYGRTHLVAAGPKGAPALVLLHADFMSLTMWAANIADLSRDHRVYAVDVMGQPGKSVPDKPLRTRDDAAAWITEVLDGLELRKPTLGGMSYGGWFSLNYAIRAPARLERLILLSPGGSFLPERLSFYLLGLPATVFSFLPQGLLFDRFFHAFALEENLRDPIVRTVMDRVGQQTYLGLKHFSVWKNWQSQNIEPHVFPDEELRGMHVPTLLLIGQQESLYDPVAALERARKLIPDLESGLIPQATHGMTQEQHELVDKRILAFLQAAHTADQGSLTGRATSPVAVAV